jgi:hypothetical protein
MKVTRRRFLHAGSAAIGAATVLPAALEGLAAPAQSAAPKHVSPDATDFFGKPVPVKIKIAAAEPIRVMRGGIGASFHVISTELPSRRSDGNGSWSGSEWGGNPEPTDARHWDDLFKHADWLGMDWCRVELEQRVYEPGKRQFSWDNSEMQVLYLVLDWAQRRGVDVFLTQMWANVGWNSFPESAADPVKRLRSGPKELNEFAFGLGELIEHLAKVKGYTCIKWVVICNEPEQDSFSWWQDVNMKAMPITPGLKATREEFDRRGLTVPLSGPDWPYLPPFDAAKAVFDPYVGAYDFHSYDAVFDSMHQDSSLAEAEQRLAAWAKYVHAKDKALFLSELGTMGYGWGNDDAAPACYMSGLKNASLVVRGINAGVDGFNRWSFTNRGDLDGQWQLVRTWDIDNNKLLEEFTPQPNAYYQYAMLTRYFPKHSGVLATTVDAPFGLKDRKLVATALRSPKGNLTVLVVNESHHSAAVNIDFDGLAKPVRLQRYSLTKEAEDKTSVVLNPERSFEVSKTLADRVQPMCIVVYSTYELKAGDPGLINE